jgi:plastocyanin
VTEGAAPADAHTLAQVSILRIDRVIAARGRGRTPRSEPTWQPSKRPPAPTVASTRPQRYSALDVVTIVALGLSALSYLGKLATIGHIIPPVLVMGIVWVLAAVVMATGWRWAAIPALIISLLTLGVHVSPGGFPLYGITHPGDRNDGFFTFIPIVVLLAIATLASGAKLVLTVRHRPSTAPRWFTPAVTALIGFGIGALLLGAFAGPTTGGAVAAQAGTEVVHLTGNTFSPNIVALHTGDTLALVGDSPTPHIIANGSWNSGNDKTLPATEAGAPVVNNVTVNNSTVRIGPFTTTGTYHLYCSVHPGMNLTVIVQ